MDLRRRVKLYLFGTILGVVLSFFFMGDRLTNLDWGPEARLRQRLGSTLMRAVPEADPALRAWPATLEQVRAAIATADVDLKNSRRTPDSIYYVLDGVVNGKPARFTIVGLRDFDRDSTAVLWELAPR